MGRRKEAPAPDGRRLAVVGADPPRGHLTERLDVAGQHCAPAHEQGRSCDRVSEQVPPLPAAECRQTRQVDFRSWFINGSERMRLPVAAKIALSTAGAATAIVGSPTPPQKSPVGMMTTSTLGISSIRITL